MLPSVSIIIPVYNGEKLIEKCLDSINNLEYPKDKYEIIVIDGGSTDKTINIVQRYENVKLIYAKKGTSHQRNVGIKEAKGELIAFTDADCIVDKNWLNNAVEYFNDKEIALVGGPNLTPKDSKFLEKCSGYLLSSKLGTANMATKWAKRALKEANETDLIACNNIVRKDILIEVNGFNEHFFPGEENELYFRILEKGYKFLYNPKMIVWHHRLPIYMPLAKQIYNYGKYRAKLIKTHPKIFKFIFILPILLILYLIIGGLISSLILMDIISIFGSNTFSNSTIFTDSNLLYFYFGSVIIYYIIILIESFRIAVKNKSVKSFLALPLGFFLLHCSYGFGFLKGIIIY